MNILNEAARVQNQKEHLRVLSAYYRKYGEQYIAHIKASGIGSFKDWLKTHKNIEVGL